MRPSPARCQGSDRLTTACIRPAPEDHDDSRALTILASKACPARGLRDEIDALNDFIYPNVNNGVYRCGFATTQEAYEEALHALFGALDALDDRLGERRDLVVPNLSGYLRELHQRPGIADTVDFRHIKDHHYRSHSTINPTGIVPYGPEFDLDAPHGRDHL